MLAAVCVRRLDGLWSVKREQPPAALQQTSKQPGDEADEESTVYCFWGGVLPDKMSGVSLRNHQIVSNIQHSLKAGRVSAGVLHLLWTPSTKADCLVQQQSFIPV